MKIKASKIKIADLRFYKEGAGIELTDSLAKGLLVEIEDGNYINPLSPQDSYPIFKRACISNVTSTGQSFGTKMYRVDNDLATGPCWVLSSKSLSDLIGNVKITYEDLENYVLTSKEFFWDRKNIAERRLNAGFTPFTMVRILRNDEIESEKVYNFFKEREMGFQKVKED